MAGNLKGLTIEIGGDTTKLDKALKNVDAKARSLSGELGQVNRLLKFDPGNADLLAQKQQILAEAISNTRDRLDTLKEAERQVQAQFERGEVSADQVRALQREIVATEQKLGKYEQAAKETAESLEQLGQNANDAAGGIREESEEAKKATQTNEELGESLDESVANGFMGVLGAAGAAVGALVAATESTRDYRMEMGKLDTAFTTAGFSSEAATGAYQELVGVLGETDQAVEAANHLAKLTDNEKDLATWTGDILPGVFATFGDSLPIEGLTEAANETAKVGAVTGPLADALNWAGISEDAFNESLAKCTTEQERQALITETLAGLYGEASAAYKETNADVIAANQANDAWTASLAGVGAAFEPVLTKVKETGASLLSDFTPALQWILDNLPTVGVLLAGATAALIAYKVAALATAAAQKGMTIAQMALNAVMSANPIGLIIMGITLLVAAFVTLWNNCEGFRNFFIAMWEGIKVAFAAVVAWIKQAAADIAQFFTNAWATIEEVWSAVTAFFSGIWNGIKPVFSAVGSWFKEKFTTAKDNATKAWSNAKSLFSNIWSGIKGAFSAVGSWFSTTFTTAKDNATKAWSNAKSLFSNIWSGIKGAFSAVGSWFSTTFSTAKDNATKAWANVKSLFSGIWGNIKSAFQVGDMSSIGRNILEGLWSGISSSVEWLRSKVQGVVSKIKGWFTGVTGFNTHSPSKWSEEVMGNVMEGLDVGAEKHKGSSIKNVVGALKTNIGDAVEGGLTLDRQLQTPSVSALGASGGSSVADKLDRILAAIERGQVLTIDGNLLVGATADRYDSKLGQRRALAARGAV